MVGAARDAPFAHPPESISNSRARSVASHLAPLLRGEGEEGTASRSRRLFCARLIVNFPPSDDQRAQGMPGDDLTHGPPATKKAGGSHHRFSRITRHSPRNGFTAYIALSPGTGLSCPRHRAGSLPRNLAPASGRQDHTTSPSASGAARLASPKRPPHPVPTSVTIAKRPSW